MKQKKVIIAVQVRTFSSNVCCSKFSAGDGIPSFQALFHWYTTVLNAAPNGQLHPLLRSYSYKNALH